MSVIIRDAKDFWSGVIFITVGLTAIIIGQDYTIGNAGRMGPGYFPTVLGAILALLGTISVVRSLIRHGTNVERFAVRSVALVVGATVLFGLLVRFAGLAPAIIALVLLSGVASSKFRFGPYMLLAVGMAAFAILVFIMALGLPIPVFPLLGL